MVDYLKIIFMNLNMCSLKNIHGFEKRFMNSKKVHGFEKYEIQICSS
jgi:hypothetical protein